MSMVSQPYDQKTVKEGRCLHILGMVTFSQDCLPAYQYTYVSEHKIVTDALAIPVGNISVDDDLPGGHDGGLC